MKLNREEKKQSLTIMKNFVEGRMSTIDFWNLYKNNNVIRYIIIHDKKRKKGVYIFDENTKTMIYDRTKTYDYIYYFRPENLLEVVDISIFEHRVEVYNIVKNYFLRRKKKYKYYNDDEQLYNLFQSFLPEWLDMSSESIISFILNIWQSMPKETNEMEKTRYCKNKILEFFKYNTYPPKWLQNCEWPIYEGHPLLFIKQEEDVENGCMLYFFINEEKNEEITIKQND